MYLQGFFGAVRHSGTLALINESDQFVTDQHPQATSQDLAGMTACMIVDGCTITNWQAQALNMAIARGLRVTGVLVRRNPPPQRRLFAHVGYRLLQLTTRTTAQQSVRWDGLIDQSALVADLEPEPQAPYRQIPAPTQVTTTGQRPDIIINFGMHLAGNPNGLAAPLGVVSFHHSDPAEYQGGPPGFYEVLNGASHVGATVQRLNDTPSAGEILALSAHRVVTHSYALTLTGLYDNATHLLVKALVAAKEGTLVEHRANGSNHRLPSNATVLRFIAVLAHRKVARLVYGTTRTKQWRIGRTQHVNPTVVTNTVVLPTPTDVNVPNGFQFLADPLPGPDGTIWCEAMDSATGLGRIMVLTPDQPAAVVELPGTAGIHLAYPFVVEADGMTYLVPGMAGTSALRVFVLHGTTPGDPVALQGLEHERLADPTLHRHEGRWWLFAGKPDSSSDLLWLWSSTNLLGPYESHPQNPIVMDPSRARSGGPIITVGDRLFRPGQNNTRGYGDGVTISEIVDLTTDSYVEVPRSQVRLVSRLGPHTLIVAHDHCVVDSYTEAFDPLAWLHRLRNRAGSRESSQPAKEES